MGLPCDVLVSTDTASMNLRKAGIISGIFAAAFAAGVGVAYLKARAPLNVTELVSTAQAAPSEQPIGLSRDAWEITATHQHPENPPRLAIDADPTTLWTSGEEMGPGMSLTVDLRTPQQIAHVILRLPIDKKDDRPRGLTVETSPDGEWWETVPDVTVTISEETGEASVTFPPRKARSVRLTQTGTREEALAACGHGAYWWSVGELYLKGP